MRLFNPDAEKTTLLRKTVPPGKKPQSIRVSQKSSFWGDPREPRARAAYWTGLRSMTNLGIEGFARIR